MICRVWRRAARRLIHQQDFWIADQHLRQPDPLCLAAESMCDSGWQGGEPDEASQPRAAPAPGAGARDL